MTPPPERRRRDNGDAVVDGVIQYFSSTSLQLADPSGGEGCPRKWYYEKILGKKPPETRQQSEGKELHAQNELYERTGVNALGSLAMRGKHMLLPPGDDLLVEQDMLVTPELEYRARAVEHAEGSEAGEAIRLSATLADAPLRLVGRPYVGYIDLAHRRGVNQGAQDVEDAFDPPNTGEVLDWKSTSSLDWVKNPQQVSRTIQMTSYGKWMLTVFPDLEHIRLSHGYYITRGSVSPRKVSLRVLPEVIERQWEHVEGVARLLDDVAREREVDQVPANNRACGAFRGCPHRTYCSAGAQQGLVRFFGAAGAARIAASLSGIQETQSTGARMTLGNNKGGVLGLDLQKKVEPTAEEIAAEERRLAAEEARAKYPGLAEQWTEMQASGVGTPILAGAFAQAVSDLTGAQLVDGVVVGTGSIADSGPFEDPSLIGQLMEAVKEILDRRARGLPDFAPDGGDPEQSQEPVADTRPPPQVVPDLALAASTPATASKKRGRPPKDKNEKIDGPSVTHDSEVLKPAEKTPESVAVNVASTHSSAPITQDVFFYIDAEPRNAPSQSFWPQVYYVLSKMAEEAGLEDVRQAPNSHQLGYGNWKYALDIALQVDRVPPGHWVLETTGTELSNIVVQAMMHRVQSQGALLVTGDRR